MIDIRTAAPFARHFEDSILVIKIGGACLERPGIAKRLAVDLSVVQALGARLVVVHGAGPQVDALQRTFGEEPHKVEGRRITSAAALLALRHASQGQLSGEIAASLTANGAPAVGLSSGGANILIATRRPPQVTQEGRIDFGFVGDINKCDPDPLWALVERGFIPVLSPPAGDGRGGFLNVNADLAAAHVAIALGAKKLVLVTSTPGILTDPTDAGSLVSNLSVEELSRLASTGGLVDGMAVKAQAIQLALQGGVKRAHVVSGMSDDGLLGELYTTHGTGTLITSAGLGPMLNTEAKQPVAEEVHQ